MKIVWDEPKRLANLAKHGLDFAEVTMDFFHAAIVLPARGRRLMAIGAFQDGTVSIVFLKLGTEGISLISMRAANAKERRLLR